MIPGWRERAACQHHKPELFNPITHAEPIHRRVVRVRVAAAVCNGCPVKAPCKQAGKKGRESGVWGGVLLQNGRRVGEAPVQGLTVVAPTPDTRAISLIEDAS